MQTNGTLISLKWARFFKEHCFGVGISLDGPEQIHNHTRKFSTGIGSFERTMKGIGFLHNLELNTGAIAVINSYSVQYPHEIFSFFYEHGIWFSANSCDAMLGDPQSILDLAVDPMEYAIFLLRVFDLWLETDNPHFMIKPITDFVRALMGKRTELCKFSGSCYRYITIDTNGDVYPCCEYKKTKYLLGNLLLSTFEEIACGKIFQDYYSKRQERLSICGECKWVSICQGWCRRNWEDKETFSRENGYCDALQLIFSVVSNKLNSMGYNTVF
jgi:uncharacterized protein